MKKITSIFASAIMSCSLSFASNEIVEWDPYDSETPLNYQLSQPDNRNVDVFKLPRELFSSMIGDEVFSKEYSIYGLLKLRGISKDWNFVISEEFQRSIGEMLSGKTCLNPFYLEGRYSFDKIEDTRFPSKMSLFGNKVIEHTSIRVLDSEWRKAIQLGIETKNIFFLPCRSYRREGDIMGNIVISRGLCPEIDDRFQEEDDLDVLDPNIVYKTYGPEGGLTNLLFCL